MKQFSIILVVVASLFMIPSCHEGNDNDGKTTIIQDSLNTVLPTWQALHIKVSDDKSEMIVAVGDIALYKSPIEVKNEKAQELGRMILRIYGKDNYLEKGTLVVTTDIHNTSSAPADGISVPIDFAGLKKMDKGK